MSTPKIKLNLKTSSIVPTPSALSPPPADNGSASQKKRPSTKKSKQEHGESSTPTIKFTKKRALDDGDAQDGSVRKQPKLNISFSLKSSDQGASKPKKAVAPKLKLRQPSQKLSLLNKSSGAITFERRKGHGYDSEAEEVEEHPLIEHQFVVRMLPGDDCDYLHNAISNKLIGTKDGDVKFRFFDKDGRKSMISIRTHHYAATIVDLPCIIEGLKSWDRRNFYKVADIHQMLVVTKRVKDAEEAKDAPPPEGVDPITWQFPHGLTPPMHWVRKRRFRKRVDKRTIEAVEDEVKRLIALDEAMEDLGGGTTTQMFDPTLEDDEVDAEGEEEEDYPIPQAEEEEEEQQEEPADDLFDEFEQLLAGGGQEDDEPQTPQVVSGTDVVASPETIQPTIETPGAASSPSSEEDDNQSDVEMDEEERQAQQQRANLQEEVVELREELERIDKQMKGNSNMIIQNKLIKNKNQVMRDLSIKLKTLGEDEEENDE